MTQPDSYQAQECTQGTLVNKTFCWCCMKPVVELYWDNKPLGTVTYKLGDCCKELSTEVIHTPVDEIRHAL